MSLRYSSPTLSAGVPRAPSEAIRNALRKAVAAAAERLAAHVGVQREEATSEFRALAERLQLDLSGGEHADGRAFSRRHIDLFRAAFVEDLEAHRSARFSAKELLDVLLAFERLAVEGERELSGEFAEHIGNDALRGMVEIAHDMRSPLGAILLLVEPIRRGLNGPVNAVQERQLAMIYGAALSLSTLANDIIDGARGPRHSDHRQRPFSVSGTIESACAVVRPMAEEKELDLQQTYPSVDGRVGDASALHRVLLNLITNAIKYTERGYVAVGCTEIDEMRVEFWVKDTGPGFSQSEIPSLCDGFRPGPNGMHFSSSGLGLSICKKLLSGMGAEMKIETAPNQGARFSFVLDLEPA